MTRVVTAPTSTGLATTEALERRPRGELIARARFGSRRQPLSSNGALSWLQQVVEELGLRLRVAGLRAQLGQRQCGGAAAVVAAGAADAGQRRQGDGRHARDGRRGHRRRRGRGDARQRRCRGRGGGRGRRRRRGVDGRRDGGERQVVVAAGALGRPAVLGVLRRALGHVGVVQARLHGPEARAALGLEVGVLLERLLAGVVGARPDEGADLEDVVVLVEDRRRGRLVVDVLQQRLEAGVALAAGTARVLLDGVLAVVEVLQDDREVLAELGRPRGEGAELGDDRRRGLDGTVARLRCAAQRPEGRPRGVGEGPELVEEGRQLPGRCVEVAQRRALVVGYLAEGLHRRLQLLEEAGQLAQAGRDVAAPLGRGLRGVLGLGDEAPDVLAVGREVAHHLVGVDREIAEDPVLRTQRGEHLVGLAQGGAGAADGCVEVLGVARHAGAQRADDEAQALAVGAAQDVVDEVRRDGRRRARHRDDRARLEHALGRAGLAVDEVLADERLRARLAEGVRAQRAEAVLVDLEADERVLGALVELDVGDLPARTPATLSPPPWMRPKALSNCTQYLPLSGFRPAPVAAMYATPRPATSRS